LLEVAIRMRSILRWLASLFHVEVVWVEKGQGRWVRRRYYHPLTSMLVIVALLGLCIWGSVKFYRVVEPEQPDAEFVSAGESSSLTEAKIPADRKITGLGIHDFPEPRPIPSNLAVIEDEYWLRVSKGEYRLYLYRGEEIDKTYLVAVGKNPGDKERAGDNRTPNGIFTVQSIEDSRAWTYDFRDGKGVIRGAYGPWFIRLRTGWRGIGIHGTHDPDSRGSMVSEGCIRMANEELEELKKYAFKDMKVVIEE